MARFAVCILKALFVFKIAQCQPETVKVCPEGLVEDGLICYKAIENAAFPFECPFKSTETVFASDVKFNHSNEFTWVEAKRDEIYGYFEHPKLHLNYGYLLDMLFGPEEDNHDCLTTTFPFNNYVELADCDNKFRGFCIYKKNDRHFCNAYNKICKVQTDCSCRSDTIEYMCQMGCSNSDFETTTPFIPEDTTLTSKIENITTAPQPDYNKTISSKKRGKTETVDDDCSKCDEKFLRYPRPEITLNFDRIDSIRVEVKSPLKLIPTHEYMSVYCFTDVMSSVTSNALKLRYGKQDFTLDEESESQLTYTFKIASLAVGYYWCEGFSLPDAEKIESNKVLAGLRAEYGLNFVLNFTLNVKNLLSYDIHTASIIRLRDITNESKYKLIRLPQPPPLFNNRREANLTVHLTTFLTVTDAEAEHEKLRNLLEQSDFDYDSLGFSDICLGVISLNASWPTVLLGQSTPPREILLQENGLPITRRCRGSFMEGAYWSDVMGEVAGVSGSEITDDLHQLANSDKTAEELNQGLWDITSKVTDVIPYDVHLMAEIFGKIARSKQAFDPNLFVRNVNSVTRIDFGVLQLAQDELNSTDAVLYNVDLALGAIAGQVAMINITTKNIMASVMRLDPFADNHGFAVYQVHGKLQFRNLTKVTSIDDIDLEGLRLATFIPPSLLQQILAQNKNPSLIAAVYTNDVLFRSNDRKKTDDVASFALSIYVTGFTGVFLQESLPIIFSVNSVPEGDFHCGFWEYGIDEMLVAIQGRWRKSRAPKSHDQFKLCTFSHMTHFALLVNAPHNQVLDLISLIGCGLSIFGIVGIVITAFTFKTWRDSAATKILLNLSLNILAQMLLLFLWKIQSASWCKTIAIGLHYIVVSQFCWMLVIGYLQYRKFVRVLLSEPPRLLLSSYFTGWIMPIIPVVLTYFLYPQSYAQPNYCYLVGLGLYLGLFLPIGCIILSNATIFFLIFASLSCTKIKAFGAQHNLVLLRVKLCVILFFLLGFSWLFGLLAHFLKSMVLSYMFCVTTTTQGFVLYVFFVVCDKTTRKFWLKKFAGYTNLTRWAKGLHKKSDKRQITKSGPLKSTQVHSEKLSGHRQHSF